jgi:6-phosphogluconolactonase (cycloisomerase 2 family)
LILFEKKTPRGSLDRYVWEKMGEMDRSLAAITLLFKENYLYSMEFYSSLLGIFHINKETGKMETRSWEGEKEAQAISHLTYHYTAKLLSKMEDAAYSQSIIENVLKYARNEELGQLIVQAINQERKLSITDFQKWLPKT